MRGARSFDAGVIGRRPGTSSSPAASQRSCAARISANVLNILGVQPIAGRGFRPDEDTEGAPPVALISERLWTSRFAKAPAVVGSAVTMNSTPFSIIGVLRLLFQFRLRDIDVWLPRPAAAAFLAPQFHGCCTPLLGVARLRPASAANRPLPSSPC